MFYMLKERKMSVNCLSHFVIYTNSMLDKCFKLKVGCCVERSSIRTSQKVGSQEKVEAKT